MSDDHFLHSSLREGLLEHLLAGAVMQQLWQDGCRDFELLRPITDAAGYDIVLTGHGVTRHVQLKASVRGASTSQQKLNLALRRPASGCVVWMIVDPDTLDFDRFYWFGGPPGQPLPDPGDRVARHSRANAMGFKAQRPNIRVLIKGDFTVLADVPELTAKLFGPAPARGSSVAGIRATKS